MANVSVYNMEGNEVGTLELNDAAFCPLSKKNGSLFWFHYLIRNFWKFAKNERKKSSKSFSDLLLHVPLRGGGIFSFYVIGQAGT